MRKVREEYRLSRNQIARSLFLTPHQLNRIERGEVALRFGPGWKFCEVTQTNPLWLTFGDRYARIGFVPVPQITALEKEAPFLQTILGWSRVYEEFVAARRGANAGQDENETAKERLKIKMLVDSGIKYYLSSEMNREPQTWEELRALLRRKTESAEGKTALAKRLRVSLAAISQWRSGKNKPSADNLLQIRNWVFGISEVSQPKKSAGGAGNSADAKDPKRKIHL